MALSAAEMQALIDKLVINIGRLNTIVNGNASTEVTIDSGTVPTVAKAIAQIIATDPSEVEIANIKLKTDILYNQGANIAGGSTVNLALATGSLIFVTGTPTVTSFGTEPAGAEYTVRFLGNATIIASSAIKIPGNVDLSIPANESITIVSLGSGNWIVKSFPYEMEQRKQAINAITTSGPLVYNLAYGWFDKNKKLLTGITKKGQILTRDNNGALFTINDSTVKAPTTYDFVWDSAGTGNSTIRPNDGRLTLFAAYGQSYTIGTIDTLYYNTVDPVNSTAFDPDYALMPSVGLFVPTDFNTLVGLKEQKNGNGVTVETLSSEWVKGVHAGWVAAGLAKSPIVAIVDGEGGRPVQRLMPGGPVFEAFMLKIQRVIASAALTGKSVVCPVVCYLQGQDNRSMPQTMTRYEWARAMKTMQRALEYRIKAMTGQVEPVVMLIESISRGARPAEITLGAALAAAQSPGQIVLLNPDYALEHYADGDHPAVAGYMRLGRYAAKATLGTIYGLDYRPMIVRRHWMQDTTHLRIEIEVPKGSTLTKDSSDALVQTTGLNAGAGILAYDKSGSVAITSTAVVTNHPAANNDICGTIEVEFTTAPDINSLVVQYANERPPGSGPGQGGLGGSVHGPRGLFRAAGGYDAEVVSGLTLPIHSWVQPFELV